MLTHLSISNLTIIKQVSIDWQHGFCGITGETGAGKSIAMDALNLCLGQRADPGKIRRGEKEMIISASFDISDIKSATSTLDSFGISSESGECIIRRVVTSSGPSKSFINGHPVTVKQLTQLGLCLVSVCSQHEQYALLKGDYQRDLLDKFCSSDPKHKSLLDKLSLLFKEYQKKKEKVAELTRVIDEQDSRKQLLSYQVDELGKFEPLDDEFDGLESDLSRLENAQELKNETQRCAFELIENDNGSVVDSLKVVTRILESLAEYDDGLTETLNSLNGSVMEIEEAAKDLRNYSESTESNPEKLNMLSERHSQYIEIGRKHGTKPNELAQLLFELNDELKNINNNSSELEAEKEKLSELKKELLTLSESLNKSRQKGALALSSFVKDNMADLGMKDADVSFEITSNIDSVSEKGYDRVSLQFLGNAGENFDELSKVASGGELSRLNLILQLAIADSTTTPTLVFDEVDTGISGPTAAKVGKMLKKLGKKVQVISITHLPQVTAFADSHLYVSKLGNSKRTETSLKMLSPDERVDEMARLLAGENINDEARKNALTLLDKGRAA